MRQSNRIDPNAASRQEHAAGGSRARLQRNAVMFLGLFLFWLALVGTVDVERVVSGIFVAGLLVAVWSRRMQSGPAEADVPVLRLFAQRITLRYFALMAVEIVKANWAVAKIVLSRKPPISPHFVHLKTKLTHNLTRVVYATSITITPGTITVSLDGDDLIVHAITRDAALGVQGWVVEDYVKELEAAWQR